MDLTINLETGSRVPLHRQLYEEIRRSILTGVLGPGSRVPSTRELAGTLGVSRTTVTQSYDQLISEGYLQSRIGSGTIVSKQLPDDLISSTPVNKSSNGRSKKGRPALKFELSRYGASLEESAPFEPVEPELPLVFKTGCPALDEFPRETWRRLLNRNFRDSDLNYLDYAKSSQGDPGLREAIAQYIGRSRAVRCSAEQVLIVNGSQQALDLVSKVLIDPGTRVAVEEPGYLGARRTFLAAGANLIPARVDENGLLVSDLISPEKTPPKLIYVTPSHQFPTGAVLCLHRRLELLSWAEETGTFIIEDDYDSEFRYDCRPIPALQGLTDTDNVIYVGTFSKVLFPALRVGYMVLPEALIKLFNRARWLTDRHTPTLEQRVLTDFINEGHLERHLRRMRQLYDTRRQVLVNALKSEFGDRVEILGENAGMHLMVRLQSMHDDNQVLRRTSAAGLGLVSARIYYLNPSRNDEFVLGYGGLNEEQIIEGIERLYTALS